MAGKTILLVDDQELVRHAVKLALSIAGHRVDTAENGLEALKILERGPYDLVITDWKMPEMTGEELAEKIREKFPNLPILLLTGYPPETRSPAITQIMLKPFTAADLHETVRTLVP